MAKQAAKRVTEDEEDVKNKSSGGGNSTIVELDMNLEDMEDFEILPDGNYPGTITLAEMRTSPKGNDYYYVTFKIDADDFPADYAVENAPEGINLTYARVQKPTPTNRRSVTAVKKFMAALGLSLKTSTINPGEWEGRKASLKVGHGDFNGEQVNQIVSVEQLD